jgi:hypothetical protein
MRELLERLRRLPLEPAPGHLEARIQEGIPWPAKDVPAVAPVSIGMHSARLVFVDGGASSSAPPTPACVKPSHRRLGTRQPSGREKDEASIRLLAKLRDLLYSSDNSTARQSAFNLSWMQEDGLDILREGLLGNTPRRVKSAAAYGLRKMRGRMRKGAEAVLTEGANHPDSKTAEIARNALIVLRKGKAAGKRPARPRPRGGKLEIKEIPDRARPSRQPQRGRRPDSYSSPWMG